MATVVEVLTSKPSVKSATLKFSTGELSDLKVYITEYYKKNYGGAYYERYRNQDSMYKTVVSALEGTGHSSVTKVADAVVAPF